LLGIFLLYLFASLFLFKFDPHSGQLSIVDRSLLILIRCFNRADPSFLRSYIIAYLFKLNLALILFILEIFKNRILESKLSSADVLKLIMEGFRNVLSDWILEVIITRPVLGTFWDLVGMCPVEFGNLIFEHF
jgi:hypothetical protein